MGSLLNSPALRLVGFFVLALILTNVLREVPFIGPLFGNFFAFWIVVILLGVGFNRLSVYAIEQRLLRSQERLLGAVESAHNQGKLGSLLLTQGRARRALPYLEGAVTGEPEVLEWCFRLGMAQRALDRPQDAIEVLERVVAKDEEYAYGQVLLELAAARLEVGEAERALEELDRFERNHGPKPESAYRRGLALRALGKKDQARASFASVSDLARQAARFQNTQNRPWVLRALWARLI